MDHSSTDKRNTLPPTLRLLRDLANFQLDCAPEIRMSAIELATIMLIAVHANPGRDKGEFKSRMSQAQMGRILGAHRGTVSKVLNSLAQKGLLQKTGKHKLGRFGAEWTINHDYVCASGRTRASNGPACAPINGPACAPINGPACAPSDTQRSIEEDIEETFCASRSSSEIASGEKQGPLAKMSRSELHAEYAKTKDQVPHYLRKGYDPTKLNAKLKAIEREIVRRREARKIPPPPEIAKHSKLRQSLSTCNQGDRGAIQWELDQLANRYPSLGSNQP